MEELRGPVLRKQRKSNQQNEGNAEVENGAHRRMCTEYSASHRKLCPKKAEGRSS